MAERPRLRLPFGGGVDRYSGSTVVEPVAFRDLRNVHLRRGGAELRGGLALRSAIGGATALIGIFPIRSQGVGAAITYDATTRDVKLYLTSADGTATSLVGTLWTLPVGSAFPRVLAADFDDQLVIAHDEPVYSLRRVTKRYDPTSGNITNLQADLYLPTDPPTLVDVKFRGVTTYLEYLVGWGYGSENPGDENKPEVVRFSKPGEIMFLPEHYFIAGTPGDPVLVCVPAGDVLLPMKPSSNQRIIGADRATFGIVPNDRFHGVASSRLAISVGDVAYFWSLNGPRRSAGGASEDMGLPLDLDGPAPDVLAQLTDLSYGFAAFRPDRAEIEFIFGRWSYVYHMGEPGAERWSFRVYGVELAAAGVLYEWSGGGDGGAGGGGGGGGGTIGTDAFPTIGVVTADAPVGDASLLHVPYTTTNALSGGEVVELWAKSRYGGDGWVRLTTAAADAVGATITANVDRFGTTYDVAVRFTRVGVPGAGYTSGNPFDWPSTSRAIIQTAIPLPSWDTFVNIPVWSRASALAHGVTFTRTAGATPALHPELTTILEHSADGGGSWTPHTAQALSNTPAQLDLANALSGLSFRWRMKDVSGEGVTSGYFTPGVGMIDIWNGPANLTGSTFDDDGFGAGLYHHSWSASDWPAGADATWAVESTAVGVPGGATDGAFLVNYPATEQHPSAPCGVGDVEVHYRVRRTQFGVNDFSAVEVRGTIPANC